MDEKVKLSWKRLSPEEFTKVLVSVNEALGTSDEILKALVFLCRDFCPVDPTVFVQPLTLFNDLLNRREISHNNVDLLVELLWRIGRKDLVAKFFVLDVNPYATYMNRHPCLSQYRVLLHELCEGIVDKTLNHMKAIDPVRTQIGKKKLSKGTTPQDLFAEMENHNLLSERNLDNLISMVDIVADDHLHEILAKHKKVAPRPSHNRQYIHDMHQVPHDGHHGLQPRPKVPALDNNHFSNMHRHHPYENGMANRLQQVKVKERLAFYPMNARPRGHCVIINNMAFKKDSTIATARTMKHREGADQDIEMLVDTWQRLDFSVTSYKDLTSKQMERVMYEMGRNTDHSDFDAFVCCILSHGATSQVYGCDGVPLNVKEIVNYVKPGTCQSLVGKPKLFFFQACQGGDRQEGYSADQVETDDISMDGPASNFAPPQAPYVPNEADILISYATVPGFVSYRSKTAGSFYISKLSECLNELAGNEYDLMTILTEVNRRVSEMTVDSRDGAFGYKQVPQPQTTLRKQVFFD